MPHDLLATRWEGTDLLVLRNDEVADRIAAAEIRRVILACEHGDTPSDLSFAVLDVGADHVILPANSPSRSHLVAIHFSPATTGAPPCRVLVLGCGRS
jgi:hypothetical protein